MWQIYGKGGDAIMLILDYVLIKNKYSNIAGCIYEGSYEYNMIKKFLLSPDARTGMIPANYDIGELMLIFPYLAKDSHYKYEKEVRIFGRSSKQERLPKDEKPGFFYFNKNVLKGIMIGPCSDSDFEKKKTLLEDVLNVRGYQHSDRSARKNVKILSSKILLRYR